MWCGTWTPSPGARCTDPEPSGAVTLWSLSRASAIIGSCCAPWMRPSGPDCADDGRGPRTLREVRAVLPDRGLPLVGDRGDDRPGPHGDAGAGDGRHGVGAHGLVLGSRGGCRTVHRRPGGGWAAVGTTGTPSRGAVRDRRLRAAGRPVVGPGGRRRPPLDRLGLRGGHAAWRIGATDRGGDQGQRP